MIRLGVNLDHVATLRNARGERYPSPVQAAIMAELGGADNITCHLREDRRHIRDRDMELMREVIQVPLNFEMAATDEMLATAVRLKPHAVTLVPEKRQELTTEGGLNLESTRNVTEKAVKQLQDAGILVSLFIESDPSMIRLAKDFGADAIEIHTGVFCRQIDESSRSEQRWQVLRPMIEAASLCHELGMQLHFGHGLHYNNANWLQLIPFCEEANIGHSIIARSIFVGLENAVREMKQLLNDSQHCPEIETL